MTGVIDAGEGRGGPQREVEKANKNGNYCNLRAVGGQLGGPATLLTSAVSDATAELSSQEVHSSNLCYYLSRL